MVMSEKELRGMPIMKALLASPEPSLAYRARTTILGESQDSPAIKRLRTTIRSSQLARDLLSPMNKAGQIITAPQRGQTNPYQKWQGPHWTLVCLAEIDYPPGDRSLMPMRDQYYDYLFAPKHMEMPHTLVIPGQEDRVRRCAGQEGYAVWYSLKLGIDDERTEELVERIRGWQWPDGGWNCDKRPEARLSSFHESLIPIRALALHGRMKGDNRSLRTAKKAAGIFLERRMYKRRSDGTVIHPDFARTMFPHFYQYNILFGLKVMAEAGFIDDRRCDDALDLLESKVLPDGGFPLEKRQHSTADTFTTRGTFADWGPSGRKRTNMWVTAEALHILRAAERL